MISKELLLKLNFIPNVGPATVYGYVSRLYPNCLDYTGISTDSYSINKDKLKLVEDGLVETKKAFEEELLLIKKHKINFTTILDKEYPQLLKEIHLPPPVLYWKGIALNFPNSLAFVGARKGDFLAREAVDLLVPAVTEKGFAIISGGAEGVDTMAHKAALASGGNTVAVLGSGLLEPYPYSNIQLFKDIEKVGAVVSSFPLTMPPMPENFPARNRIVSGLSRGTVVVQAAKKSGARITAEYALNQGRDVFAVPGPFNHRLSEGCNRLIQEGAKLAFCADDILSEYFVIKKEKQAKSPKKMEKVGQKSLIEEDPILAACISSKGLEELQNELKIPLSQLQERLFDLQLEGKIQQNFAGLWHRI